MPEPSKARRPRRDAAANRQRILDQAEELFESVGLDVGFHRIASDLGIGVGTIYRHFPDRDALFLGLYERYHQRIDELGKAMTAQPEGMPRVLAFVDSTIAFSVRRPIARRVAARVRRVHPELSRASRWQADVADAVRRAQADGELRKDVDTTDVAVLAGMLADLAAIDEPMRSTLLPRMRALALDALRPADHPRPTLDTAPLEIDDITELAHGARRDGA